LEFPQQESKKPHNSRLTRPIFTRQNWRKLKIFANIVLLSIIYLKNFYIFAIVIRKFNNSSFKDNILGNVLDFFINELQKQHNILELRLSLVIS